MQQADKHAHTHTERDLHRHRRYIKGPLTQNGNLHRHRRYIKGPLTQMNNTQSLTMQSTYALFMKHGALSVTANEEGGNVGKTN